MNRIKSNKIILKDQIFDGYIYFDGGEITSVTNEELPFDAEYNFDGKYVSPGFIDIHTHGGGGFPFDGSIEDVVKAADFHLIHGTTSIVPTISAAPFEVMKKAAQNIKKAIDEKLSNANIIGAHMEGPYLSKSQAGGQCADQITCPDAKEYSALNKGVARWTYAPENDENNEFLNYLTQNGIVASAGHTDAVYDDIDRASKSGLNLITHLYSCTSTVTRSKGFRSLGVIESAYLDDDMYVEIIADGKHLPPELIKLIIKIKGTDKVALVTDSLHLAGTDIKEGKITATEFIIEDGVCKLKDRSAFAGSIATADRLIRVVVNEADVSITDAVKMMSFVPAQIMKLNKGELTSGKDADIIVFDEDINISDIFVMGNKIK